MSDAARELFDTLDSAMGPRAAGTDEGARDTFKMLFAASMQGIAALVAAHRISRRDGDRLVGDAMEMMLGSDLASRTVSAR